MADDAADGAKDPAPSDETVVAPDASAVEAASVASAKSIVSQVEESVTLEVPAVSLPPVVELAVSALAAGEPDGAPLVPDIQADIASPPEVHESLAARGEPLVQERGLYTPGLPARTWSPVPRRLLLGVGFLAPCVVIALSLYFIVKGGAPHEALVAPAVAPAIMPDAGEVPHLAEGPDEEAAAAQPEPDTSHAPSLENAPLVAVPGFEDEGNDEEPASQKPAVPKHFGTVQDAALGSCSTESVDGLSRQIIEQARCIKPNDFVALPKRPNLTMKPQVFPYLEMSARDHLLKVLDAHPKQSMTINSALRTVAQQYLVSHWAATKICGVQLATRPGESNHEIGSALDIAEAAQWRPALEAQQFHWLGASDRVHFDYKGDSGGPRTATDVLAFQKLWNRNHTDDAIPENGLYGPPTEQRLKKSPPNGFPLGSSCRPTARKR